MQLVSSFVVYGVFRHCRDAIHRFNLARKRLQNLTMEEARIPALFRCNVALRRGLNGSSPRRSPR